MSTPNYEWMNIAEASRTRELAMREQASESDALPYAVVVLVFLLFALGVIALILR